MFNRLYKRKSFEMKEKTVLNERENHFEWKRTVNFQEKTVPNERENGKFRSINNSNPMNIKVVRSKSYMEEKEHWTNARQYDSIIIIF